MNKLLKKAAAFITAGIMASACFGAECYAESGKLYAASAEMNYAATVAKPTYTVKGSAGVRKIRLSTTTSGATIYYTTNGATPTTSSKKYTGALLKITKNTQIKAIAVKGSDKSTTMVKTFSVATKYGDVTGDGVINSNDYTRLKNYLAGSTTYICKDNADCDGSGGLSSKDLTVLNQYLNGKVKSLPSKAVSTVAKPTATMTKVYGGKKITLKTSVSGATIYYTTNGATPTTGSNRYTAPFTIESTKTIKAIAYKNGESSAALSFSATVGSTSEVRADKSTSVNYNEVTNVVLSSATSGARIYYTIDGSDPRTSTSRTVFSNYVRLTENTVIRAYAQSKGNTDSSVSTFQYKVNAGFAISGTVWDDTPSNSTAAADGKKASNESGISGINVYLINTNTNTTVKETKTASNGSYAFSDIPSGYNYKVSFGYNGQKYRAYGSVVSGGNQAVGASTTAITIKSDGAYNSAGTRLTTSNSYSSAVSNSYFTTYATTSSSYNKTTADVNLALISKNYGSLAMSMTVTGQDTNRNISKGASLTYNITLTNKSSDEILSNVVVGAYISDLLDSSTISVTAPAGNNVMRNSQTVSGGFRYFTITNLLGGSTLRPGSSITFTISGTVSTNAAINAKIYGYAEVKEYRFYNSCYDYNSIPGNLSLGYVREPDEAYTPVITVVDSGNGGSGSGSSDTEIKKSMSITPATLTLTENETGIFYVTVLNGTGTEDVQIIHNTNGIISVGVAPGSSAGGSSPVFEIYVNALTAGTDSFKVQLVDGNTIVQEQTLKITVNAAAAA